MSTLALSLVRGQIERLHPPRALHCEFPLGRPLGRPGDGTFQRRVLMAAFRLLDESEGPVLVDFPERVDDAFAEPLSCPLPPRQDPEVPAVVEEARGLRAAYDRTREKTGRTLVGRAIDADGVPDALQAFLRVADGTPWKEAGLASHPLNLAKDVVSYYEEAAAGLVDHVPEARAAESWVFRHTEAGKLLKQARLALKEAKEPSWFYLIPFTQGMD